MKEHNPLHRGLYADQLERWFRVFDRSQVWASAVIVVVVVDVVFRMSVDPLRSLPGKPITDPTDSGPFCDHGVKKHVVTT